jgi:hypothetical protein
MRELSIYDVAYGIQSGKLTAGAVVALRPFWTIDDIARVNRVAMAHGLEIICRMKGKKLIIINTISAGGDAASLPSCYVTPPPKARAAGAQKTQGGERK